MFKAYVVKRPLQAIRRQTTLNIKYGGLRSCTVEIMLLSYIGFYAESFSVSKSIEWKDYRPIMANGTFING